ncbi:MAG: 6-carboxytetrahydropterin synthase QueD [Victivallaceae bacterium]|nr:6-carboxytetrahydropterin synthase QueD [Victivallaceae bacterium]
MFEIEIERAFSAAHHLRGYCGNCSHLHGHNYVVAAGLRAEQLDEVGIAVDFRKLKDELDAILARYDHADLNELEEFQAINPTSEVLARHIYRVLSEKMNSDKIRVIRIRVRESPGSTATYFE